VSTDDRSATLRGVASLFDPVRLRLARHAAGLRKNQLAQAVGVSPAAVSQYENGTTRPSPAVVARLALALGVPAERFLAGVDLAPVIATTAHFRSLRATSQLERDQAFAYAVATLDLTRALGRWVKLPDVRLPEHSVDTSTPLSHIESIAERVRAECGVAPGPVPNVVRLLESRGIVCTRLPAHSRRVYAFSAPFAPRPVVVLSLDREHRAAARFDAAHELGHLVLHHDAEPGTHLSERQAHTFAAAFLAPREQIIDALPRRVDWAALLELKRVWGMSMQALLYRARTIGTISEASYRRAMTEVAKRGWRTNEPGDNGGAEVPALFSRALTMLAGRGVTLADVADAAALPITEASEIVGANQSIVILDERSRAQSLER
jgi:Zn-dependent peptidase ImmA (M78 family)/DNA-binding XRE family transcriptional regulator